MIKGEITVKKSEKTIAHVGTIIDFSGTNKTLTAKLLHMKKYFLILSVAILNICLIACNGSGDNGNQNSNNAQNTAEPPNPCYGIDKIDLCKDAGGIANIVIESTQAKKMIQNFKDIFKKEGGADIRAFEPVYWLDKCVINGVADFLRSRRDPTTGQKFDGIRIYMACELSDNAGYGTDLYKRRTAVYIFPTINEAPTGTRTSNHKTIQQKISLTGTCSSFFLQDYATAYPQHKAFDTIYRKEGTTKLKDSLSRSIWIDSCIVFTLQKLANLRYANIDGININMATYDKTIPVAVPGRGGRDIVSTVILVPTHMVGSARKDYWDITDCLFNHAKALGWAPPSGLNHGELCPQICN